MKKYTGWLFDLYSHPTKGIVLWLIGEDGKPVVRKFGNLNTLLPEEKTKLL